MFKAEFISWCKWCLKQNTSLAVMSTYGLQNSIEYMQFYLYLLTMSRSLYYLKMNINWYYWPYSIPSSLYTIPGISCSCSTALFTIHLKDVLVRGGNIRYTFWYALLSSWFFLRDCHHLFKISTVVFLLLIYGALRKENAYLMYV